MKHTNETIEVRLVSPLEFHEAGNVLGNGMRDNPLCIQALGTDISFRERALSKIFPAFVRTELKKGKVLGAYLNGKLVGICGMLKPGLCQLSPVEKIKLLPLLIKSNGFSGTFRMLKWFGEWEKHDYKESHWHLGPVGIKRDLQRQGIGSLLLQSFCNLMDQEKSIAYLETDKPENVEFYKKFGFEVIKKIDVIGTPNWLMARKAQE